MKKHSAELDALMEGLPMGIAVGVVYVNAIKVRDLLVKKKEKLVTMLKALCARMPKKMMAVRVWGCVGEGIVTVHCLRCCVN